MFFAGGGREPRARRAADAGLAVAGAAALLLTSLVAGASSPSDAEVGRSVRTLLGWLEPVWRLAGPAVVVLIACVLVAGVAGRRRPLVVDVVASVAVAVLGGALLARTVDGTWPAATDAVRLPGTSTYPVLAVAAGLATLVVAAPALTRPVRRAGTLLLVLAAIAPVALGQALPSSAAGGVALGLVSAAVVRLARGSSAGFPDAARVAADLDDLGLDVAALVVEPEQPQGVASYRAVVDGVDASVFIHGRDARDAQYLASAWRRLWYRDGGPLLSSTRREQVEHEALLLLLARTAGGAVPSVLAVGGAPATGDALLVTSRPSGRPLAELAPGELGDAALRSAWDAVARLHAAGIAHGELDARAVVVTADGAVVTGLGRARAGAPDSALAADVATLLVSTELVAGDDTALSAAVATVGPEAVTAAIPYLQRAALTPWLRDAVRRSDLDLDDLRRRAAGVTGADLEPLAQLHRVRLRDLLLLGLTLVAVCTLWSSLADVGLDTVVEELAGARWAWVVTAVVVAQTALIGEAVGMTGAVPGALPLGPTVVLQSAIKFVNLTVPSVAGKLAVSLRYLQRLGVPTGSAVSQGALDSLAGFAVQAVVLLLVLPGVDLDLDLEGTGGDGDLGWLAVVLLAALVGVIAVVALVPPVRNRVVPVLRAAWDNVVDLGRSPRRLIRLVGGNVGAQIAYALCLGASLAAYGASVPFGDLLFANVTVSLFAGLMPVPGGIGVSEAALTTVLVALGVDQGVALAAAITHRLASYYLPPIWGYVSLRWLGSHGYL